MAPFENDTFLEVKEPLINIWGKPQKTLNWIFQTNPKKYLVPLLILGGITLALNNTFSKSNAEGNFFYWLIIFEIILGSVVGWLSLYFSSMILSWTGSWIGGNADTEKYVIVVAWSNIPWICSLIVWLLKIIIWEDKILLIEPKDLNGLELYLYLGLNIVETILGIWSVIILIRGISLIQNFTTWKVLLNFLLSFLLFAVPIALISGLIYILNP